MTAAMDPVLMELTAPALPAAERAYVEAAEQIAAAWRAGDPDPLSRLGPAAALALPEGMEAACRRSVAGGHGLAALRLAAAHLEAGGGVAFLGAFAGNIRLIAAADDAVVAAWGRDPAADAEAAALLAHLFRALDPTDSYLYAARWAERAAASPTPAPGGGGDAPAWLAGVWTDWFGLRRVRGGLEACLPPGAPAPGRRTLAGIALRGGGRAVLAAEGGRGTWSDGARQVDLVVGVPLFLEGC